MAINKLSRKQRAALLFMLASLLSVIGFVGLFAGGMNVYIGIGIAILGFVGFIVTFNAAWAEWEAHKLELTTAGRGDE